MDKPAYWTPRSEIKEGVTVQCSGFDCLPRFASSRGKLPREGRRCGLSNGTVPSLLIGQSP